VQVALGGVPVQFVWHCAEKCALHEAMHWPMLPDEEHSPLHCASACALQSVSQLKVPCCAVQFAMQSPLQLAVHDGNGSPVHMPSQLASRFAAQAASKCTGVQFTVQPPITSAVHVAFASTSMLLQAAMLAACATFVDTNGMANRAAANTLKAKEFFIKPSSLRL
jgi:hypothetical protein